MCQKSRDSDRDSNKETWSRLKQNGASGEGGNGKKRG